MFKSKYIVPLLLYFLVTAPTTVLSEPQSISKALIVSITPPWDVIDPGVAECFTDALAEAESSGRLLIVMLDTYGGWLDSAFVIGDATHFAKVPVIGYVSGTKALSAGTMVLLPAHVVALSPGSIIGAMQPVTYNPLTGAVEYINESKVLNPIIQKALLYAQARDRNGTVVKEFIRSNLVLSSRTAIELGIADLEAGSLYELLSKLNGRYINASSFMYRINVSDYSYHTCSLRSRTLSILTNTLISNIFITVGVLSLIYALAAANLYAIPLALIFLILGLIGSGFNPNIGSLLMLALGSTLLVLDLFVIPGFGVIGISGAVLLALGLILMPVSIPSTLILTPQQLLILRALGASLGVAFGCLSFFILVKVIKAKRAKSRMFTLEGKVGRAVDRIVPGGYGYVLVEGEYWLARSDEDIESGERVYVVRQEDKHLLVRKYVT